MALLVGVRSDRPSGRAWLGATGLALGVLCCASTVRAATPPAGTAITNQAAVDYRDAGSLQSFGRVSETVTAQVTAVPGLTLVADRTLSGAPGSTVVFDHTLSNTGNASLAVALTASNAAGDDYDLEGLRVYRDLNGNSLLDAGEPEIPPGGVVTLGQGEFAALIVAGAIPVGMEQGKAARVDLDAGAAAAGIALRNTDTATAFGSGVLALAKSIVSQETVPGGVVAFGIVATNSGVAPVIGYPVTIDGVGRTLLVLRDAIPANTDFESFDAAGGGVELYHLAGAPEHSYLTTPPADRAGIDAVAAGFDIIPPGASRSIRFSIRLHANVGDRVTNTARGYLRGGDDPNGTVVDSNVVEVSIKSPAASISYYTSGAFDRIARVTTIGRPLFVQADAADCNADPAVSETKSIVLTSESTGDREEYLATETGPNTGVFRIYTAAPALPAQQWVPTRSGESNAVVGGNGIIETEPNDRITATLAGCGNDIVATASILVDPFGVVFDTCENLPVPGATVTLIDVTGGGNGGRPGEPATVWLEDGATLAPAKVTTGTDGRFHFPLVKASRYRLQVTPPNGYSFPSALSPEQQPPGRTIDAAGSYGGEFAVSGDVPTVIIDVPVDCGPIDGLFLEKTAAASAIEVGDFLDYTLKVINSAGVDIRDVTVSDRLPAGFKYRPGTTRVDGKSAPDPAGGVGPTLVFTLGKLPADTQRLVTYRALAGPASLKGDGVNRARADALHGTTSNEATWKVRIAGGALGDKGYLVGTVYLDCNGNLLQDDDEPGVPGARLYLEDGTFAITDGAGKYSLYALAARTHVVKLDRTSIPVGTSPAVLDQRNTGDGGSRFVDLKWSELARADFALAGCGPTVLAETAARSRLADGFTPEEERGVESKLTLNQTALTAEGVKSQPASGVLGTGKIPTFESLSQGTAPAGADPSVVDEVTRAAVAADLEQVLRTAPAGLAFLDHADHDVLILAQANVLVGGPLGGELVLTVNGRPVSASRVGRKVLVPELAAQAWEFVGVALDPGGNRLTLGQAGPDGVVSEGPTITLVAPGNLKRILVAVPPGARVADGSSVAEIKVKLIDERGIAVASRTSLTLETTAGRWETPDLNPAEPGVQTFLEGGRGTFSLVSPTDPGETQIRISSGRLSGSAKAVFVPELRPLVAVGVVEGVINFKKLDAGTILPASARDGFEDLPAGLSFDTDDGKISGGARAAIFLKGRIRGDMLLTLSYDSDKDTRERLFRDIQPDEFYPVYGDSSVKGFDAQSSGRLYVRIDKNRTYLLYGDFTTPAGGDARSLGAYSRSLTGPVVHYETARVEATAFASRTSSRQVIDEFAALGISGPYFLSLRDVVVNSEKVEILVRDRNQPAVVLSVTTRTRFVDYALETMTGRLLFNAPVASLDENLNPVSIRVTYEVDDGGEKFWVGGAAARVKPLESLEIGGAWVRDENPADTREVKSANATLRLAQGTYLLGEVAATDHSGGQGTDVTDVTNGSDESDEAAGLGWRVELRHDSQRLQARAYIVRTDPDFDNPSAPVTAGREEWGAKGTLSITPTTSLQLDALRSDEVATGDRREGVSLMIGQSVGDSLRFEVGMRRAQETPPSGQAAGDTAPIDYTSGRARISLQLPALRRLGLYGEYEQNLDDSRERIAAAGLELQIGGRGRLYARHEFISSLGGEYELNSTTKRNVTVVGLDADYMEGAHVFSEYRVPQGIAGRDAEAAIGLRNLWNPARGLSLSTSVERVESFSGTQERESTAATVALAYTARPDWKGTGSLEWRDGARSNTWLNTLGLAWKFSPSLTALGRNVYSRTDNDEPIGDVVEDRLQVGFAWRPPRADLLNALARYERRWRNDESGEELSRRVVDVWSLHLNYRPARRLTLAGTYALKKVREDSLGYADSSSGQLLAARASLDIGKRWDVGLMGAGLYERLFTAGVYGLGLEVGYLVDRNIWVSAGYNLLGFTDKDLATEEYTDQGFYLRLRLKFDESVVPWVITGERSAEAAGVKVPTP